ncbi:hypothetical protein SUGI_0935070 [Cryptomeria japonica]|nr:hypothetical protein SUGI_0935070 [Cryptomeria japonica]
MSLIEIRFCVNIFGVGRTSSCFLLKSWYTNFNPSTKSFDKIPLWVKLLNLPLHLWFDSYFERLGDSLGSFLMVDECSSNLLHSTYARILVEMDVNDGIPTKISIQSSKSC